MGIITDTFISGKSRTGPFDEDIFRRCVLQSKLILLLLLIEVQFKVLEDFETTAEVSERHAVV